MGCGSSKDERVPAVEDKPQPIKKIRTNFSDVHYDEPASGRRDTVYAPSEMPESRRPTEIKEEPASPPAAPVTGGDGMLSPGSAPVTGGDGMLSPGTSLPASPAAQGRSQSWYKKYLLKDVGPDKTISDEEMKKYTGMDRAQLAEWAKDKPVGPRQDSRWAGDSMLYMGGAGDS